MKLSVYKKYFLRVKIQGGAVGYLWHAAGCKGYGVAAVTVIGVKTKGGVTGQRMFQWVKNDKEKKLLLWIMWHSRLLFDAAAYI